MKRVVPSVLAAILVLAMVAAKPRESPRLANTSSNTGGKILPAGCTVRRDADGWWFISPKHERFFSLGVSVVDQGTKRTEYQPEKPSYAAWRHYGKSSEWSAATLGRLKSWGFTTIGGWSDPSTLDKSNGHDMWLMPVLSLGAQAGAPWWDMWDENNLRRMDEVARNSITPLRDDPRVVGYYSDNEIGWWDGALWRLTFEQAPTSEQRRRLINLLRDRYHNNWDSLIIDFEPENALNWQELEQGGRLWHRPGGPGIHVVRDFLGMMAERYYQLMHEFVHRYDPDTLYLGDRFQSFYYPEVARACGRHVDVVSTNLSASWNDGTFIRSYLDTLNAISGKPILVSEFYVAAEENRSGNNNTAKGFPIVATQPVRAAALSTSLQSLTRIPYVVGAEWFQYYDEPPHGRFDGEDYNFGLVDIHDRPYEEMIGAVTSLNVQELKSKKYPARIDATSGVPIAPADPFADFEFMRALKSWDRERGFIPPTSKFPTGDMYISWSPDAVYLSVYVLDVVDTEHYRGAKVPEVDRGLWRVRVGNATPFTLRVGYGEPPLIDDPKLRFKSMSGVRHLPRSIAAVEIPARLLGKERLKAGDRVEVEASYDTHGRAHRIEWRGDFPLIE